jgi:hypothetical protein
MSLRSRRSTRLRHVFYPGSQGTMLVSLKTSTPISLTAGMPIAIACPLVRYAILEARRHGQNAIDLLRAQHCRQLQRFLEVPHLGRQVVATQRDAKQRTAPRHDPIAVTDARTALDEVQLETAHLLGRRRIGRPFEPSGKPLAAINVAALRVRG